MNYATAETTQEIKGIIEPLVTRGKLRKTQAGDSWCQNEDFKVTITDKDGVSLYNTCFTLEKDTYDAEDIDTLFMEPARLSIVRKFTQDCVNVEIGKPFVTVTDETETHVTVTVFFPVNEV